MKIRLVLSVDDKITDIWEQKIHVNSVLSKLIPENFKQFLDIAWDSYIFNADSKKYER